MSDSSSNSLNLFAQMSPISRHYAYGADSYPNALRCISPILVPSGTIEGCPAIGYFTPPPGSLRNIERLAKARDDKTVLKVFLDGCREDGLSFLGDGTYRQPGYETVALFYSPPLHPVFARAQGENWIVKQQLDVERSFSNISDVERFLGRDLYTYMLAPLQTLPRSYSEMRMNLLAVPTNRNDAHTAHLFEMEKPKKFGAASVVPSLWLKLDTEKEVACAYDPETFEPISMELPMPAWRRPVPARPVPQPPAPRALAPEPYI